MTYLPDVNVWIALAAEQHIIMGLQGNCRVTQMGFPRLLTNKHVMQEKS